MNKHRLYKVISIGITLLMLLIIVTACGSNDNKNSGSKKEIIELKIADISSNPVFRVAINKGIFEQHGIKAELVNFATPAEGINSLFIKQVDIAWGADFPILNAVSKGEYSIIAATGTGTDDSAKQWKLYVRDDIKTGADLKGKVLSFFRGTFLPYLWDVYLTENGLNNDDVKLLGQGGFDESYVAIKKGEIDAVWVTGAAMRAKFDELENVHVLTDMSETSVRLGADIIATNDFIVAHPEGIVQFLQAIEEATEYSQANPEETAEILFKEVKQPKEATIKDLPVNKWIIGFDQIAFDSLTSQKEYMVGAKIIEQDFNLEDKLNLDALKQAFPDRVRE